MNLIKKISLLGVILTITACSNELPQDTKTMAQVYFEQTGGDLENANDPLLDESVSARQELNYRKATPAQQQMNIMKYTRNAENEINNLFPRLQNPDLVMYVFPHLSETTEAMPIPGYTTVFPMFGTQKYAQAGDALTGL